MQTNLMMNETFNSCRPWAQDNLRDNLNILNNFKLNLFSYEKVYKKYSIKTKDELPEIKAHPALKTKQFHITSKKPLDKTKNKTLQSNSLLPRPKQQLCNKSMELQPSRSQSKLFKTKEEHKRGQTSMDVVNKQNKQSSASIKQKELKEIVTERRHYTPNPMNTLSKGDLPSKVCMLNFDEQYKYRRLRKRELHQIIFGKRQKLKKRQIAELR